VDIVEKERRIAKFHRHSMRKLIALMRLLEKEGKWVGASTPGPRRAGQEPKRQAD
jgi:hypothetical protein